MKVLMKNVMKKIVVAGLALLTLLPQAFTNGQDPNTIKALFIYNFTKHVEWPKGKINGKFTIGIWGNTPVSEKLTEILRDRKIKDHEVVITGISSGIQIETCDVLFVAQAETSRLKEINEKYDFYGVLIVTEDQDAIKKGSCINIIERNQKMKFEIDDNAIKKQGLKISNQLYDLAEAK